MDMRAGVLVMDVPFRPILLFDVALVEGGKATRMRYVPILIGRRFQEIRVFRGNGQFVNDREFCRYNGLYDQIFGADFCDVGL